MMKSSYAKTLCHSMGNPLKVAEDIIELEEKRDLLNSLLKIVTFLSSKYAMWASIAAMTGDCQYPETSFVFDEQQDHPSSYRKEIAHMARYYRLHLGSFLAIELAKELKSYPSMYKDNRFESIIELYEIGCADYIFNFVVDINDNTREEKLVTPILMNLENENKRILGVHVYGDEKISNITENNNNDSNIPHEPEKREIKFIPGYEAGKPIFLGLFKELANNNNGLVYYDKLQERLISTGKFDAGQAVLMIEHMEKIGDIEHTEQYHVYRIRTAASPE